MALAYLSLDFKMKREKKTKILQDLLCNFMYNKMHKISWVDEEPDIAEDTFLLVGKALVELGETIL